MDVNGTLYHLVRGSRDWLPALTASDALPGERLAWDPRSARVTLQRELFRFPPRGSEDPLTPDDRRGAARDRFGHTYWINADRDGILYRPAGTRQTGTLWTVDDLYGGEGEAASKAEFRPVDSPIPELPSLCGLAVTDRHFLVVGSLDPGGLLVFDLHGGGRPQGWRWPESLDFRPFDLAAVPGGGVWILDRPEAGGARLWRLDRDLRVVHTEPDVELRPDTLDDFKPVGGEARTKLGRRFPTGIDLALASPIEAEDAVAVVALPDESVLLLESPPDGSIVRRLQGGQPPGEAIVLAETLADLLGEDARLLGHDMAFLGDPDPLPGEVRGTLWIASAEGNQSYAFALFADLSGLFELTAVDAYLPMRRFAGKALIESVPACGTPDVFYDLDDGWLALTEVPRPRFEREGQLDGLIFDGKEPSTVWHRLFLDACIPPGSRVEVESRAADDLALLAASPWRTEPAPGRRPTGPRRSTTEQPWHPSSTHTSPDDGTWELLFQQAHGRWLELRLTFRGNGRSTPRLGAMRVHYPRFSYLGRYLPAVYREDPASASFLDRFLSNFEGFFTEIEGRVAGVENLFDHRTVPAEALDWLAGWLGATLEPDWDEARRRLFIAHAFQLYRRRGTPRGLVQAVRLAVDDCPSEAIFAEETCGAGATCGRSPFGIRLVEGYQARRLPAALLGDATDSVGPALIAADEPWRPSHGRARLDSLWREFLDHRYGSPVELRRAWGIRRRREAAFPPTTPGLPERAADWRDFLTQVGLPYAEIQAGDAAAVTAWRKDLAERYRRADALNDAWGLTGAARHGSFASIELPSVRLPADGAALEDWIRFVTVALPIARSAHQFTVLVPVAPETTSAQRLARLDRVRATVEREKPSHTEFDVRLYWALFRVGSARVALDTALGEGSRLTALTLGASYLGESLLAEEHPWNIDDRRVAGRDTVGGPPPLA